MITRFGSLRVGDKFLIFNSGPKIQDEVSKEIWTKSTTSIANNNEDIKRFESDTRVFKLKKKRFVDDQGGEFHYNKDGYKVRKK